MATLEPPDEKITWVRVERTSTGSWMTLKLPRVMRMEQAECFIQQTFPGWEFVQGGMTNLDEEAAT